MNAVDTNVLIYACDQSDGRRQRLALDLITTTPDCLLGFDEARVTTALRRQLGDARMAAGWVAMAADMPVGYLLAVYVLSLEHLGLTAEIDEFYIVPGATPERCRSRAAAGCRDRVRRGWMHQCVPGGCARKRRGAGVLWTTRLHAPSRLRPPRQDPPCAEG